MQSRKKAQASFEYILIAGVIGIMILPAAYLFYSYSQSSGDQIDKAQLDKLGRDIVAAAEKIYYQGPPSRTELEARMPKGITNLSIEGDWGTGRQYLLITARSIEGGGEAEYPYRSSININGSFNGSLGAISISPGIKKIVIEAYDVPGPGGQSTSFTNINLGGRCPPSATYDFNTDGIYTGADSTFFKDCYCNNPGFPRSRPSKTWVEGWFATPGSTTPYMACMNADYDGDCQVGTADTASFCAVTGLHCGGDPTCP